MSTEMEVCSECGAVGHGNMFCNRCRTVNNERHGWKLPPWEGPPVRPCGAEDIEPFLRRLEATNAMEPKP